MLPISWLMHRCSVSEEAVIDMNTLYTNYEMECMDNGEEPWCSNGEFRRITQKIFPQCMTKKITKMGICVRKKVGIKLKPLDPLIKIEQGCVDIFALPDIISLCANDFRIMNTIDDVVECSLETDYLSNGNVVQKRVLFNADFTFQVFIGDKQVDLHFLGISDTYQPTLEGISEVAEIVRKILLCHGVDVTEKVIHVRPHREFVENWTDKTCGKSTRQLRVLECLRVIKFNVVTPMCRKCYRRPDDAAIKCPTPPPPITTITKEDLKRMIPIATEEMLDLLMSQVENGSKAPTTRRWSTDMLAICAQIYSRSPRAYRMIRDHQLLLLPTPGQLFGSKSKITQPISSLLQNDTRPPASASPEPESALDVQEHNEATNCLPPTE